MDSEPLYPNDEIIGSDSGHQEDGFFLVSIDIHNFFDVLPEFSDLVGSVVDVNHFDWSFEFLGPESVLLDECG